MMKKTSLGLVAYEQEIWLQSHGWELQRLQRLKSREKKRTGAEDKVGGHKDPEHSGCWNKGQSEALCGGSNHAESRTYDVG